MSERDEIGWTETMAAAGWPDPFEHDERLDWEHEQTQAYWASPAGVAEQFAQAIHEAHTAPMYSLADVANGDTGTVSPGDCPVCTPGLTLGEKARRG